MIVEISEHGSALKRNHDCFVITNEKEKNEIPAEKVDAIIITANAMISTAAIDLCLEKEVQLVIADWNGKPLGRFWRSNPSRNTELRRKQYAADTSKVAFEVSTEIVELKLKRQKTLLIDLKNNRKDSTTELDAAIGIIDNALVGLSKLGFCDGFKQTLLGIEGSSASAYFKALSSCLSERYRFDKRSRSPAADPFNACLNYIYGCGYNAVEKVAILSGFDPNAGFYHEDGYGKPTLSFDLIELVRAKLDRTVITLFSKRKISDDWFSKQDGTPGIFLTKNGRSGLLDEYVSKAEEEVEREAWTYCKKLTGILMGDAK